MIWGLITLQAQVPSFSKHPPPAPHAEVNLPGVSSSIPNPPRSPRQPFYCSFIICFKFYLFIFREGEGRKKEKERNINMWEKNISQLLLTGQLGTWPTTQAYTLTRDRTSDLSAHRPMLSPLSHTSQRCSFTLTFFLFIYQWPTLLAF